MNQQVQLRDVEPDDLPLFFEHQRDPEALAMVMFNSRDRPAFDAHWAKILASETGLTKTIIVNGQTAGHIVSFIRDGEREIGYWLDRAFWGRGIATQALSAFLQMEKRRPLHAGVAKHNSASMRVLQKCGFRFVSGEQDPGDSHAILILAGT
ncbi:MAG: GNAT family N-acetyltransferase [Verrucomicrobia bacterium]|nr:GNAT family N-acetyltransferase [Verrucomicrobiota bacterium]